MRIKYIDRKFGKRSLEIIEIANQIIEEYQEAGFDLTLRQLYYQFVSRDIIPNRQAEYSKLGNVINDARLAGLIDWEVIVDRTRNVCLNAHWERPSEIIKSAAAQYQIDKRSTQDIYLEVWIEKDALSGIISGVCNQNDVPYFSCRGYTSQSEMWGAARRIIQQTMEGGELKRAVIIHLGDHDPSGLDMTRDIEDRLRMFCEAEGGDIVVQRIALNYDQIELYTPPPNPAKSTDSRFAGYLKKYGRESWELDALEPAVLVSLIQGEIDKFTDVPAYTKQVMVEKSHKRTLDKIAKEVN